MNQEYQILNHIVLALKVNGMIKESAKIVHTNAKLVKLVQIIVQFVHMKQDI